MRPALDHDEARRERTDLLDGSIGAVPLAPVVVELEQLEVAERTKGRAVLGLNDAMSADSKRSGGAA
jgi:hypothetical protein